MNELNYRILDNSTGVLGYETRKRTNYYAYIAKITFWLFCAFIIFGKDLPFREKIMDVSDVSTSNLFAQLMNIALFITACISLIPKGKEAGKLILKEKVLTIFLAWCLLSVLWSHFPLVSFKRYFQVLTAFVVFLSILVHTDNINDLIRYLKVIFSVYIFISFITVFTIAGAKDGDGMWRGLATSKNHLGQASLIAALVFMLSLRNAQLFQKFFLVIMILMSMILLSGSGSSTSLLTFLFVIMAGMLLNIDDRLKHLNIGRSLSIIVFTILALAVVSALLFAPDYINALLAMQGRNATLTGRTDLWVDMISEVKKHLLLGTGYQGFWVIDNNDVLNLYIKYIWLPQQSHNGYIDILNETGVIGFILFVGMLINYFAHLTLLKSEHIWKWFIVPILIINLTESTLFRPGLITGTFFMFSYMALFAELRNQSLKSE